ncbi:MAG: ATP-binding cassette domain-containing protein, partial [Ostreibacterium sp.]
MSPPSEKSKHCYGEHKKYNFRLDGCIKQPDPILIIDQLAGEGFKSITLTLKPGNILGLAGVVGAGRTELAETLCGIRRAFSGRIFFSGEDITQMSLAKRLKKGIVYLPEDRQRSGLFLNAPLSWNIQSLVHNQNGFWINKQKEKQRLTDYTHTMSLKMTQEHPLAKMLSGGNQQKLLIAKCLEANPKLLIIDEPTRGVDIESRHDIYDMVRHIAAQYIAIIIISSDLDEIELLADTVFVLHHGEQSRQLCGEKISVANIMQVAFGSGQEETRAQTH